MAFESPASSTEVENQPTSPVVMDATILNEMVADDCSVCKTAKVLSEDIHNAIAERKRIFEEQVRMPTGKKFVVTTATSDSSSAELGTFRGGIGPTTIGDDQLLLPEGVCDLPGEPVVDHGRLVTPSENVAPYSNYIELHVQPFQRRPGPLGNQGQIRSERRRSTAVNKLGINPEHIGNRIPGPDDLGADESLPIFRAIGVIFAASPDETTFPRPVMESAVDLEEIQHVPVFEDGPIGRIPDAVFQTQTIASQIASSGENNGESTDDTDNSIRLWLHFMQRTPAAESLSVEELHELHHAIQGVSDSTAAVRQCFRGTIVEGLVPITP